MMLKYGMETCNEAMDQLEKVRKKQKSLNKTAYDLLDQALPSSKVLQMERKSKDDEKCGKKLRKKWVDKDDSWFYSLTYIYI